MAGRAHASSGGGAGLRWGVAHGVRALALATLTGLCACAGKRDVAYRFRAPLVSSVRADSLPAATTPGREAPAPPSLSLARGMIAPPPPARGDQTGLLATGRMPPDSATQALHGLVGHRDDEHSHIEFAWLALEAMELDPGKTARACATGAELVALALERDAVVSQKPVIGDLVVFDQVSEDEPASLVGVVLGPVETDQDDTVAFVYLGRGVVRRGYVTPSQPSQKRDSVGRALNTFVKHLHGRTGRDARYLAGELFRAYIRTDRLSD